eukprot:2145713-Lingulodinium_polyedra.AAC.1
MAARTLPGGGRVARMNDRHLNSPGDGHHEEPGVEGGNRRPGQARRLDAQSGANASDDAERV